MLRLNTGFTIAVVGLVLRAVSNTPLDASRKGSFADPYRVVLTGVLRIGLSTLPGFSYNQIILAQSSESDPTTSLPHRCLFPHIVISNPQIELI